MTTPPPDPPPPTTSPVTWTWPTPTPTQEITSTMMSLECPGPEYIWGVPIAVRSAPTLTPSTSAPSESGTPSSEQGHRCPRAPLSGDAHFGIALGSTFFIVLVIAGAIYLELRRHRRHNAPHEPEPLSAGNQPNRLGHSWRIEAALPLPARLANWRRSRVRGRRREGEQEPIELRSWPAVDPASAHQNQGHENVVPSTSDQVAPPGSAY
ncbi:hypothetical protein F5B17DRAFT_373067 [Nemania serpens]|nr:hypothetical protein F5B17DRAFT_373067 [Nemania serpens]